MSLRAKLVTTIAALCMVLCLLGVGVWAAATGTVNLGGTVSFVAEDVDATVTADFEHVKTAIAQKSVTFDSTTTDEDMTEDWTGLDLTFANKTEDIVITVVVTNNNAERALGVTFTDKTDDAKNFEVSIKKGENALTAQDTVAKNSSATYTITLHITDNNNSVSGTLDVEIKLDNLGVID